MLRRTPADFFMLAMKEHDYVQAASTRYTGSGSRSETGRGGRIWVSTTADASGCVLTSNGDFTTFSNASAEAAKAVSMGRWPEPPRSVSCGSGGRLGRSVCSWMAHRRGRSLGSIRQLPRVCGGHFLLLLLLV